MVFILSMVFYKYPPSAIVGIDKGGNEHLFPKYIQKNINSLLLTTVVIIKYQFVCIFQVDS